MSVLPIFFRGAFQCTQLPWMVGKIIDGAQGLASKVHNYFDNRAVEDQVDAYRYARVLAPLTGDSVDVLARQFFNLPASERAKCEPPYTAHVKSDLYNTYGARYFPEETRFQVYAPHARSVELVLFEGEEQRSVVGMKKNEGTGDFTISLPNIPLGQRYRYRVNSVDKIDPYADKIIQSSDYTKVPYCEVIDRRYLWSDETWMKDRKIPQEMKIYELHLPSWLKKEDCQPMNYRDLAAPLIRHLQSNGYTHAELMGLLHHPYEPSWGYQVTGYFAPYSSLGSAEDLKYLVNQLHQAGIGVICDWVPQHFAMDAYGLVDFDGSSLYNPSDVDLHYRFGRRNKCLRFGSRHFNYNASHVRNFLLSSALFWLKEFHFDGIRVDCVEGVVVDNIAPQKARQFLQALNAIVHKESPGAIMIAEHMGEGGANPATTTEIADDGLGFDLRWDTRFKNNLLKVIRQNRRGILMNNSYVAVREMMMEGGSKDLAYFSHDEFDADIVGSFMHLSEEESRQKWKSVISLVMLSGRAHKMLFAGVDRGNNIPFYKMIGNIPGLMNQDVSQDSQDVEKFTAQLHRVHATLLHQIQEREWISDPEQRVAGYKGTTKDGHEVIVLHNFTNKNVPTFKINVSDYQVELADEGASFNSGGVALPPYSTLILKKTSSV